MFLSNVSNEKSAMAMKIRVQCLDLLYHIGTILAHKVGREVKIVYK